VSLQFTLPVIAHRGASGYAPENTMAAFIKAVQLGVQWVEFDVVKAASGEVIVFHDEILDRTTNGRGLVGDFSYASLRTLDAGRWFSPAFAGETIPSLHQVLTFLADMHLFANVELKSYPGQEESTVISVLEVIQSVFSKPYPQLLFSSFSFEVTRLLRQYLPDASIGLLLHEWVPHWQETCLSLNCVSVHVNEAILTPEKATEIKAMGKVLLCYTVNDPVRARELFAMGVDAVFSDVPDRIVRGFGF
jgi:glycerophosphoryl diester phosphodiesterase